FTETPNRSISLFFRNSGRKTVSHFPGIALERRTSSWTHKERSNTFICCIVLSEIEIDFGPLQ
ncbi:hypothetical protein, partial [Mesorhizobium sp.]|uniref:hypothetical protein n=1 Tax=Mesorhizobium sp. TaxID=1871066 RepID=UPI00257C8969